MGKINKYRLLIGGYAGKPVILNVDGCCIQFPPEFGPVIAQSISEWGTVPLMTDVDVVAQLLGIVKDTTGDVIRAILAAARGTDLSGSVVVLGQHSNAITKQEKRSASDRGLCIIALDGDGIGCSICSQGGGFDACIIREPEWGDVDIYRVARWAPVGGYREWLQAFVPLWLWDRSQSPAPGPRPIYTRSRLPGVEL